MPPSTKALLPVPSVKEADGDFLRADMMPLGPTVVIAYPDRRAGDEINLAWNGGPSGDGRWVDRLTLSSDGEDIIFHVPVLILMAAEHVSAGYSVRRAGSDIDEGSIAAEFTVRDYTALPTISTWDQDGNPGSQIDHTSEWFEAGLSLNVTKSLQAGDEVVFWLREFRQADIPMSTLIQETSMAVTIPVTSDDLQVPLRHRFHRAIIVANQGGMLILHGAVVRRSGYIQHAENDAVLTVSQEPEILSAVSAPDLHEDETEMFLDAGNVATGLKVSVAWPADMEGTRVVFRLGDDRTDPYPAPPGELVDGMIPRAILENHVDTNAYLSCEAVSTDSNDPPVLARSERRLMTIYRTLDLPPFPAPDSSLAKPTIDGLSSPSLPGELLPLDQAQFPGGPYVRIPAYAGMATGDRITARFHTRSGFLVWEASTFVGSNDVGRDLVYRIPMPNVAYYRNRSTSLYYRVDSAGGDQRFSPRLLVLVNDYFPRAVYGLACAIRHRLEDGPVFECLPDDSLLLTVDRSLIGLLPGDRLVIVLRGHAVAASTVIDTTVDDDVGAMMSFPVPPDLIRENAGNVLSYRATKIRGSYIEHTPFRTLTIRPFRIRQIVESTSNRLNRQTDRSPRPAHAQSPARMPNARHPARS